MFQELNPKLSLALVLLLAMALDSSAQQNGSTPKASLAPRPTTITLGQRTPDALLLTRPAVQDELKLTAEQKKKLDRLEKARLDHVRQLSQMAREAQQNQFGQVPQGANPALQLHEELLNEEVATSLGQILTPRQRGRLAQISLQVESAMAFAREDVLEKVNVDEMQLEAIHTILNGTREQLGQNAFFEDPSNPEGRKLGAGLMDRIDTLSQGNDVPKRKADPAARKTNGQVLDETLRKISRVLRKDQWDSYTRLKGPTFDLGRLNSDQSASKDSSKAAPPVAEQAPSESKAAASKPPASRKSLRDRRGGNTQGP